MPRIRKPKEKIQVVENKTKYTIDFDCSKVVKIMVREARKTNLVWLDFKPKKTTFFGLITISEGHKAGWADPDWTEGSWYHGSPRAIYREELEIDGCVYDKPYVEVHLLGKEYATTRNFNTNDEAYDWVGEIKQRSIFGGPEKFDTHSFER